jgi:hypothetical protein
MWKFGKDHANISITCPYPPMLKSEVYPVHCSIQTHWGGVGQFNIGWYGQLSEIFDQSLPNFHRY